MSSSLDHKCQRCGSQYHGQICPFCTITGLDVNALLANEGLELPQKSEAPPEPPAAAGEPGQIALIDVVSNRTFPITGSVCRFGRDISNDIVLTGDKSLSRFHFQVTVVNNEYFVEDAGSRNGTFLNGAPVTSPKKILDGDIVSAGMSRYRFVTGANPENAAVDDAAAAATETANAAASASAPAAETAAGAASTGSSSSDPFAKLMQEGQAMMGGETEEAADLEGYFNQENGGNGTKPDDKPSFVQLDRKDETPIDELFQQQIRAAQAKAEAEASQQVDAAPVQPAAPAQPAAPTREWPAWCTNYTFPEIVDIKAQMEKLEAEIRERQEQLTELNATVNSAEDVRNRVLATRDTELVDACSEIFHILGWQTELNGTTENEVVLSFETRAVAIAKIVSTDAQPRPADMANLVSSLSTYWCDHGVEPKGILVVSMMRDGTPEDREQFSKDIADYAQKKNVCLMSTVQLLAMYRDITLRDAEVESIRSDVLAASGTLSGFEPVTSKTKK